MSYEAGIEIRTPRLDDIAGIVELVSQCKPFLSVHGPYLYWMYINYWWETCRVATLDEEIIGWLSIIPVSGETYLLHQLGIAPQARRLGLGKSLFKSALDTLKARHAAFALEFTVDHRNTMALDLDRGIAAEAGLQMTRKPDAVPSLEGSDEELYVMSPLEQMGDLLRQGRTEKRVAVASRASMSIGAATRRKASLSEVI